MKHIFVFRCFPTSLQGFTAVSGWIGSETVGRDNFRFVVSDPGADVGSFRVDVDNIYGHR